MRNGFGVNVVAALGMVALLGATVGADSPVADAAMRGEVRTVRSLLEAGADVNAAQADGMTALHWAARHGNAELAQLLVKAGSELEGVTRIGEYTPLHVASQVGSASVVEALLRAGGNPVATTTTGVSALHLAALAGSAAAVAALLDHGADVNAREPEWGQTPLMLAAARNRTEAVTMLLHRGADPGITAKVVDLLERQAEDAQARQARNQVMASFQRQAPQPELWQPDPHQRQAAARAARAVEIPPPATENVERGAGGGFTALVGVHGGLTALLIAVREGHLEAVRALLDSGADINQVRPGDDTTPLLLAAINGHYDLTKFLLDWGADPNLASTAGATPLYAVINKHWAPETRHPQPAYNLQQKITYLELMDALLKGGADPNARLETSLWYHTYRLDDHVMVDFSGTTPFWRAAYGTDVEAMRLLVAYGADPNIANRASAVVSEERMTYVLGGRETGAEDPSGLPPVPPGAPGVWPIHAASGVGHGRSFNMDGFRHFPDGWLPAVKYLVEQHGADVNARDHDGFTPLHYAAARGDNELILYLVSKGADVTAVARTGQTTADMANGPVQRLPPYLETVELLESLGSKNNNMCVGC